MMQKLGNPSSRQVTFTKRKDGIVKKATELSILCGADVGLIMFSPKGRSITFASGGRLISKYQYKRLGFMFFLLGSCIFVYLLWLVSGLRISLFVGLPKLLN